MKNPIKTFQPNLQGRDFVIGDLHGSLSCLVALLEGLKFNADVDRVFSVGDLVDRGPDSLGCLSLVHEPWFHPVFANHEQMMLEAFNGGVYGNFWLQNGGYWGIEALNDVDKLPLVITVELKSGKKIHVIHAELPPNHKIMDATLADPEQVIALAQEQAYDGSYFLWGRYIFNPVSGVDFSNQAKVKRIVAYHHKSLDVFNDKLSHIISGHTILQAPMTILGQTNIDTGAYCSYDNPTRAALTCVELDTWTFYQATETSFKVVEPFVVNKDEIFKVANTGANP
jgi:serine/threonine protein phosphatase 1